MFIPTKENFTEMSPVDFEKFVILLLEEQAEYLQNAEFKHNEILKVSDGEYQIDGTIRFEVMGVNFLTLVECKKYNGAVTREKVQVLFDKIRAVGAQKGILATTSYFQSGAISYAKNHGIALIQIVDGKLTYEVRSLNISDNIYYPDFLPRYTAIMQYQTAENSITSSQVSGTNYLKEFLLE